MIERMRLQPSKKIHFGKHFGILYQCLVTIHNTLRNSGNTRGSYRQSVTARRTLQHEAMNAHTQLTRHRDTPPGDRWRLLVAFTYIQIPKVRTYNTLSCGPRCHWRSRAGESRDRREYPIRKGPSTAATLVGKSGNHLRTLIGVLARHAQTD